MEAAERARALYPVERQGKDGSIAERLQLRHEQSVPLLAQLHDRLLEWKQQLLSKRPMAVVRGVRLLGRRPRSSEMRLGSHPY